MNKITFDNLPDAVSELSRKVDLLLSRIQDNKKPDQDKLFTIEELINYLPEKPARQTVYGWINQRLIPYEKFGKRLYFKKSIIDEWLANGRQVK